VTPSTFARNKSKWFKKINFAVTQFTSYFNDRSKNFTHPECEENFYPKHERSPNEVDSATSLDMVDFSGLLTICISMVLTGTRERRFRFVETAKRHTHIHMLV
jgi:hypothetical protein